MGARRDKPESEGDRSLGTDDGATSARTHLQHPPRKRRDAIGRRKLKHARVLVSLYARRSKWAARGVVSCARVANTGNSVARADDLQRTAPVPTRAL